MDRLREAIVEALDRAPCSVRKLAEEAGVPESSLRAIRDGRYAPSRETAEQIASALDLWSGECARLAEGIRAVQKEER